MSDKRVSYDCGARTLRALSLIALSASLIACGEATPMETEGLPTAGLITYLPFSGNANDQSSNGNHGTLRGAAMASSALVLGNNMADYLELPSSAMDGLGDFTFTAWLKIDTFRDENHQIISGANAGEDNALSFWYREVANQWVVSVDDVYSEFTANSTIEDGAWHHVVVLRAGSITSLYIDGIMIGGPIAIETANLDIDAGGLIFGQDQDTLGGGFEADQSWAGSVDDLRLYSRALTDVEVQLIAAEPRS